MKHWGIKSKRKSQLNDHLTHHFTAEDDWWKRRLNKQPVKAKMKKAEFLAVDEACKVIF